MKGPIAQLIFGQKGIVFCEDRTFEVTINNVLYKVNGGENTIIDIYKPGVYIIIASVDSYSNLPFKCEIDGGDRILLSILTVNGKWANSFNLFFGNKSDYLEIKEIKRCKKEPISDREKL